MKATVAKALGAWLLQVHGACCFSRVAHDRATATVAGGSRYAWVCKRLQVSKPRQLRPSKPLKHRLTKRSAQTELSQWTLIT